MKMLPGNLSLEMRGKAYANHTYGDLEDWIRAQDDFEKDYRSKAVHLAEQPPGPMVEPGDEPVEYDDEEELDEETMALLSTTEILAFARSRSQGKGGWQQARGRSMSKPRKPTGAPRAASRAASEPARPANKCFNCGREGHRAADCRQPKREMSGRPCFNCGGTSHLAAQCKKPKAKAASTA